MCVYCRCYRNNLNEPLGPFLIGWLLNKKTARVEDIAGLPSLGMDSSPPLTFRQGWRKSAQKLNNKSETDDRNFVTRLLFKDMY